MKARTIKKFSVTVLRLLIFSFVWLQLYSACNCKKLTDDTPVKAISKKEKNKQEKSKNKVLFRIQKIQTNGPSNFLQITVNPQKPGATLKQYSIMAQPVAGNGTLLAPTGKVKGKFQYTSVLTSEKSLQGLYFNKGHETAFQQGKSIGFKCAYRPSVGAQQGDNHQLRVKVLQYDDNHNVIQAKEVELNLLINQNIEDTTFSSCSKNKKSKKQA